MAISQNSCSDYVNHADVSPRSPVWGVGRCWVCAPRVFGSVPPVGLLCWGGVCSFHGGGFVLPVLWTWHAKAIVQLDGRVLEASQVEYEPFGKTPLKRECLSCADSRICRTEVATGRTRRNYGVGRELTGKELSQRKTETARLERWTGRAKKSLFGVRLPLLARKEFCQEGFLSGSGLCQEGFLSRSGLCQEGIQERFLSGSGLCQEGILSGKVFVRKRALPGRNFVRKDFCQEASAARKDFCQEADSARKECFLTKTFPDKIPSWQSPLPDKNPS